MEVQDRLLLLNYEARCMFRTSFGVEVGRDGGVRFASVGMLQAVWIPVDE